MITELSEVEKFFCVAMSVSLGVPSSISPLSLYTGISGRWLIGVAGDIIHALSITIIHFRR
jgi:hypothetical protein